MRKTMTLSRNRDRERHGCTMAEPEPEQPPPIRRWEARRRQQQLRLGAPEQAEVQPTEPTASPLPSPVPGGGPAPERPSDASSPSLARSLSCPLVGLTVIPPQAPCLVSPPPAIQRSSSSGHNTSRLHRSTLVTTAMPGDLTSQAQSTTPRRVSLSPAPCRGAAVAATLASTGRSVTPLRREVSLGMPPPRASVSGGTVAAAPVAVVSPPSVASPVPAKHPAVPGIDIQRVAASLQRPQSPCRLVDLGSQQRAFSARRDSSRCHFQQKRAHTPGPFLGLRSHVLSARTTPSRFPPSYTPTHPEVLTHASQPLDLPQNTGPPDASPAKASEKPQSLSPRPISGSPLTKAAQQPAPQQAPRRGSRGPKVMSL